MPKQMGCKHMISPDKYHLAIRPFSIDKDVANLLALHAAVEAADCVGIKVSEESVRAQLSLAGHDPLKDRWVIDAPGELPSLAGAALVRVAPGSKLAEASVTIHPDWRRYGYGSKLMAQIIQRASELGASAVHIYAYSKHPAAEAFLQKHGFSSEGAYTELRLAEGVRLPPVIWPFGYTMRPYSEVQDLHTLTEAMNLSYIPLWGHQEVSEADMASWLPSFNQQGLFLVFSEKGRVIGISRTEPSTERTQNNGKPTGYIDAPGVVPQHRRLDLYRALVLTGIRWLYSQGQAVIEMESWGDKLEVLKMYRELGFRDIRQLVSYQKNLPGEINTA